MTLKTPQDLHGIHAALPSPNSDTGIALQPLKDLVDFLVSQGVSGLAPVGGTGDYVALTQTERTRLVAATVEAAAGRVPVIAGVLSPGLAETLAAADDFAAAGASALMVITPYYVTPQQHGIMDYFRRIRDKVSLPVVLYDIPGRTGTGIQPEALAELAADGTIIGMKASSADLHHFSRVVELCGERMSIMSGTDRLMPAHCALGARGAIMTTASLLPRHWANILATIAAGEMTQAIAMHRALFPLFDAFAAEPLPVMLNEVLSDFGFPMGPPRTPVLPASTQSRATALAVVAGLVDRGIAVRPG